MSARLGSSYMHYPTRTGLPTAKINGACYFYKREWNKLNTASFVYRRTKSYLKWKLAAAYVWQRKKQPFLFAFTMAINLIKRFKCAASFRCLIISAMINQQRGKRSTFPAPIARIASRRKDNFVLNKYPQITFSFYVMSLGAPRNNIFKRQNQPRLIRTLIS